MNSVLPPSPVADFERSSASKIRYLFSDLDDTITTHGQLCASTYQAICDLSLKGVKIIIVTGGPAGWCDCIARMWPVHGVIGEGGAFYMYKDPASQATITREFVLAAERENFIKRMHLAREGLIKRFPSLLFASDQFARLFDLAIELGSISSLKDSKFGLADVIEFLHTQGLNTKTSSIHLNATLGQWDKLSSTRAMVREIFAVDLNEIVDTSIFVGDSLNDDAMFGYFKHSIGVANVRSYLSSLVHSPKWITQGERGSGFVELAQILLAEDPLVNHRN